MSVAPFPPRLLATLKAPGHANAADLELAGDGLVCPATGETFPFVDGVPSLFVPDTGRGAEVTDRVRAFYEENPFPNYDGVEEFGDLVGKGFANRFSADLLAAIGHNKTVLECGCGTGQLSHFLQLNHNWVLGVDMSRASLKLAIDHKHRNELARAAFAQMNIFDLAVKDASFDVVISHGVLHSTRDARRAFAAIARKVKPGGLVMVGLYNRYARIPTWVRARLIGVFGPRIDYVVRSRIRDPRKAEIWIKDQYYNPRETWHSIDEVLGWFKENGIEYLNCSPPILGSAGEGAEHLFAPTDPGTPFQRIVTQLGWLATIAREGALFDMIGRRRATHAP
ncbi:MAG: methyltransferase domain-containing protein [Pseudomonadota bacterium]